MVSIWVGVLLLVLAISRLLGMYRRWVPPRGTDITSEGEVVSIHISRGKHKRVDFVTIAVAIPGSLRFSLRQENWLDRMFQWLRIAREPQTGDASFDTGIYIECEDPALLDALEFRPSLRGLFLDLLRPGAAKQVICAGGRLWAYSSAYNPKRELSNELLALEVARDLHPGLRALRAELPQVTGGGLDSNDGTRGIRRRFSLAIGICFVAGTLGLLAQWLRADHQVVHGAIVQATTWTTVAVGAVFLVALFTWLRGTSITHYVLLDILLAAVPTTWIAASGAFLWFNQAFDSSTPRDLIVPMTAIYSEGSRKSQNYYLEVPGWPDEQGLRKVELNRGEFELVQQRTCVRVLWRDGRLGDGWIEKYLLPAPARCHEGVER